MAEQIKLTKTRSIMSKDYSINDILQVYSISANEFYVNILHQLVTIESEKIQTAGVAMNRNNKFVLYISKNFFNQLTVAEALGVIEHEILHIVLGDVTKDHKKNSHIDHVEMNKAMDFRINQIVSSDFLLPKMGCHVDQEGLPKGKTAEEYYKILMSLKDKKEDKNKENRQSGGSDGAMDNHECHGNVLDEDGNDIGSQEQHGLDQEYEERRILKKAAEATSGQGLSQLPTFIQALIKDKIKEPKPRHDWKNRLRIFTNSILTTKKRPSFKKLNRRFEDLEYVVKGHSRGSKPKLFVVRDTSGSVFDEKIQNEFLNEILMIGRTAEIILCDCDDLVRDIYKIKNKNDVKPFKGGGGTDFVPAFEAALKHGVDGLIYLTDTAGQFPDPKKIKHLAQKSIFVTIDQSEVSLPFGLHVNIKTKEID